MSSHGSNLQKIVANLRAHYGKPAPPITTDPFELALFENVGYLISDERRADAFASLRKLCGTKPYQILKAGNEALLKVAKLGGMNPERRVLRLKETALIAMNEFDGDVAQALQLPLAKAKQALRKFPGIGEPGAEKILLFARAYPLLALESNGLRVLVRLGFGGEKKDYGATYRAMQESIKSEVKHDFDWLVDAHLILRQHGKELCKANNPRCEACPVKKNCNYYLRHDG